MHVLCYWMDAEDAALQLELGRLREDRYRRGELMVERLGALGLPISFERVRQIAGDATIVRPHIAQAMVEAGVVATEKEAFERYIGDGGPAHVAKHALDPIDAVALIEGAGGVCALAHPGMWGDQSSVPDELIERMAAAGMRGLEVDHPDHTPEARERYRALAERLGLIATGGSIATDPVRPRPSGELALRPRRVRRAARRGAPRIAGGTHPVASARGRQADPRRRRRVRRALRGDRGCAGRSSSVTA